MTLVATFVQLAAELPDPGAPMFPALCGGYGGFVAGLAAWLRGRPVGLRAAGGTVVGFGVGFMWWLAELAMDRL